MVSTFPWPITCSSAFHWRISIKRRARSRTRVAIEQRLPLDRRERQRLAEGIHESVVRQLRLHHENRRTVAGLADRGHQLRPRRLEGCGVTGGIGQGLDGGQAVGLAPVLLDDPEARGAAQQDVEAPVGERLALLQDAGAADLEQSGGRPSYRSQPGRSSSMPIVFSASATSRTICR